jgi:hypothetical protein
MLGWFCNIVDWLNLSFDFEIWCDINEKQKNTTLLEQFQNPIAKIIETEAKWIIPTWQLLFLHDNYYPYMTTIIPTWQLLSLHDNYYPYMTTIIPTWRLLSLHDDYYPYMTTIIPTWQLLSLHDNYYPYMTTIIPT